MTPPRHPTPSIGGDGDDDFTTPLGPPNNAVNPGVFEGFGGDDCMVGNGGNDTRNT